MVSKIGCPASAPLTQLVDGRWETASSNEAERLIEIMVLFPNNYWSKYCAIARKSTTKHADLLMNHYEDLRDSWSSGLADWDDTIVRQPYSDRFQEQQRQALVAYLSDYRAHLNDNEIKLVNRAVDLITD